MKTKRTTALFLAVCMLCLAFCGCARGGGLQKTLSCDTNSGDNENTGNSQEVDESAVKGMDEEELEKLKNGEILRMPDWHTVPVDTGMTLVVRYKSENNTRVYYCAAVLDGEVVSCLEAFRHAEGYTQTDNCLYSPCKGLNSLWVVYGDGMTIGLYECIDYGGTNQGGISLIGIPVYLPVGFSAYVLNVFEAIEAGEAPPIVYPFCYGATFDEPTDYGWETLAKCLINEFGKERDYINGSSGLDNAYSLYEDDYLSRLNRCLRYEEESRCFDFENVKKAGAIEWPGGIDLGSDYAESLAALGIADNGYEMLAGCYQSQDSGLFKCLLRYGPVDGNTDPHKYSIELQVSDGQTRYCLKLIYRSETNKCVNILMVRKYFEAVGAKDIFYTDFNDDAELFLREAEMVQMVLYGGYPAITRYYDLNNIITDSNGTVYYAFSRPGFSSLDEIKTTLAFYFDEEAAADILSETVYGNNSKGDDAYIEQNGKIYISSKFGSYLNDQFCSYSFAPDGTYEETIALLRVYDPSPAYLFHFSGALTLCDDGKYRVSSQMLPLITDLGGMNDKLKKSLKNE